MINLAGDKPKVIAEAARVLRPGGRFAVSDVIADPDMDEATRADMAAYTGCVAGALTEDEFRAALSAAGPCRRGDPRDASRARPGGVGDRPRPQAGMIARLRRLLAALREPSADVNFGCCHRRDGHWRAGPAPKR